MLNRAFIMVACLLLAAPSVAQTPEENALRIDELTTAVCNAHPADPLCQPPPQTCDTFDEQVMQSDPLVNLGLKVLCDTLTATVFVNASGWDDWDRVIDASQGSQDIDHDLMFSATANAYPLLPEARVRFCTLDAQGNPQVTVLVGGRLSTENQRWDLSYDGAVLTLYLNAVAETSAPVTGSPCNRGFDLYVGGKVGSQQFNGYFEYFKIRDLMTAAEILAEYEIETGALPPPPPPPNGDYDFDALRNGPNVVYSNGFEVGEDGLGIVSTGTGRIFPAIVDGAGYGGTRGAEVTHDLLTGAPNTGGYGRVDWAAEAGSVNGYMNFMFRSGSDPANDDAIFKNLSLMPNQDGTKVVQILISANTGHADSLNIVQSYGGVQIEAAKSQSGIRYETITPLGDKNYQPLGDGDTAEFPANCTRRHVINEGVLDGINYQSPSRPTPSTIETYAGPCVLWRDYTWINVEVRFIQGQPFALWVDRNDGNGLVQIIERSSLPIVAAYNNVVLQSYHTGFLGPAIDKFLRMRYDNFIVSTECIRSC